MIGNEVGGTDRSVAAPNALDFPPPRERRSSRTGDRPTPDSIRNPPMPDSALPAASASAPSASAPSAFDPDADSPDRRRWDRRTDGPGTVVLEALLEISNYVGSVMELDDILVRIVEVTARVLEGQSCSVYLWNEDRTKLVMRCNVGLEPDLVGVAAFEPGRGIPGWVVEHGETVALADGPTDPRYDPLPSTLQHDFHAYLCAPLRIQEDVIGAFILRRHDVHEFLPSEITAAETIAKQIAIVVEKARLYEARVKAEMLAQVAVSLSGVAHYIKNLLVSMKGGEYLLESGIKREDWKLTAEGWGLMRRSNAKIRDLVENMLSYYRESSIHPRPVELNTLVLEVLQSLEERALEAGVFLTPDLDMRLEKVDLDPDGIQDVLINLVTNAIDAIPKDRKGVVRVQTRLDEDSRTVRVAVRDNGAGIPPEARKKLFTLFFSTKGKRGTGIGLAATRRIVADHHGSIDVVSEPGEGTEFFFEIPLHLSKPA